MKAEIGKNGVLYIKPQSNTESYALEKWYETNIDGCTLQLKHPEMQLLYLDYYRPKITLFHRLKLKLQLFLYR